MSVTLSQLGRGSFVMASVVVNHADLSEPWLPVSPLLMFCIPLHSFLIPVHFFCIPSAYLLHALHAFCISHVVRKPTEWF
jgi:hypothetical protein